MLKQKGFTLVELMISLALSGSAVLITTSILASTTTSLFKTEQVSRLQSELNLVATVLYKDIRNAEFDELALARLTDPTLSISPFKASVVVSEFFSETQNSCITFNYDSNRDGQLTTQSPNERRGYRLREGALEVRTGSSGCNEKGWQDLTSSQALIIDSFIIEKHLNVRHTFPLQFLRITISAYLKNIPSVNRNLTIDIPVNNASFSI